jgi:CheY-like chemotaxis protein
MEATASITRRILVVEDDARLRNMLLEGLRQAGYEVLAAESGEKALTLLREWGGQIDWLLTDIRLPGVIDGWVVGSEFTLNHPLRPVIYTSGYAPDFSRLGEGSVFMPKPVRLPDVLAMFERLTSEPASLTGSLVPASLSGDCKKSA